MLADRRRALLGIPQCGKRPKNQTWNPSIRTGYLRSTNNSFDSLFYNVDLVHQINKFAIKSEWLNGNIRRHRFKPDGISVLLGSVAHSERGARARLADRGSGRLISP